MQKLTTAEQAVFDTIVNGNGQPVSEKQIFTMCYPGQKLLTNVIPVTVWQIRKKLGNHTILNIRNKGYVYNTQEQAGK